MDIAHLYPGDRVMWVRQLSNYCGGTSCVEVEVVNAGLKRVSVRMVSGGDYQIRIVRPANLRPLPTTEPKIKREA